MDRIQALDILDALPPGQRFDPSAEDPASAPVVPSPEIEEARRTLEADPEGCRLLETRRLLEIREPLDREFQRAMRDVPVPAGARQRLLDCLAEAKNAATMNAAVRLPSVVSASQREPVSSKPAPSVEAPTTASCGSAVPVPLAPVKAVEKSDPERRASDPHRTWRRLWQAASVAAVLLLGVAAFLQVRTHPPAPLPLDVVRNSVPADIPALPVFEAGAFAPELPSGWSRGQIAFETHPTREPLFHLFPVGPESRTEAAVCAFSISLRNKTLVDGYLLALPARNIADPPEATSFSTAPIVYTGGMASRSWVAGDTVFICYVRGGDGGLRILERALGISLG